jgi:hypothetical protein
VAGRARPERRAGRQQARSQRPAADIAHSRFNDYFPLLELGRTDEALALLLECCRQAFQDARDPRKLGMALGALAHVEDERGHGAAAIGLERDALRYSYLAGDVIGIAVSYHNLGSCLSRHARQPAPALACHLAAALIRALTGSKGNEDPVGAAATDLLALAADATPPADVADLSRQVGDIPGTDLPGLLAVLAPDPAAADQALRDLITQAQTQSLTLAANPPESDPATPA